MRGAGDHYTVGDRIAFYRRRRGLTQRLLAELVGRSEDWLSKIERNEREVRRLDVLAEVASALRVSIGDLLGQDATPSLWSVGGGSAGRGPEGPVRGASPASEPAYPQHVDSSSELSLNPKPS